MKSNLFEPVVDERLSDYDILWRFLDLPRFVAFLQSDSLHFCRGDRFVDRFEGRLSKQLKEHIDKYYAGLPHLEWCTDKFLQSLKKRTFINCWHLSECDSFAMWRIYGSIGGVAIVTTVGKLRAQLSAARLECLTSIRRVDYVLPSDEVSASPYSRLFTFKLRPYSYEREVRAIADWYLVDHEGAEMRPNMTVPISMRDFIDGYVLDPEMPQWIGDSLRGLVRTYAPFLLEMRSELGLES